MKKFLVMLLLATAVVTVAACGKKSTSKANGAQDSGNGAPVSSETQTNESTPEETNPENGLPLSKQPDPTAPVLHTIMVEAPVNGKLSQVMDAVETLTEQTLLEKLISLGTVGEGTTVVSFTTEETGETMAAGPGAPAGETEKKVKNGKLVLKNFTPGAGLTEEDAKNAVIHTYVADFELGQCTLEIQ